VLTVSQRQGGSAPGGCSTWPIPRQGLLLRPPPPPQKVEELFLEHQNKEPGAALKSLY
jgi:hypothetical protein